MAYFSKYQIKIEKKYNIEYKEIISEQKNIISQRDDKINEQNNKLDELQNQLKTLLEKSNEQIKKSDEQIRKSDKILKINIDIKKDSKRTKKQLNNITEELNTITEVLVETKEELIESHKKIDNITEVLVDTRDNVRLLASKLEIAVVDRVRRSDQPLAVEELIIMKSNTDINKYYVIRGQKRHIKVKVKLMTEYHEVKTIKCVPNAITLFNLIKQNMKDTIYCKNNKLNLSDITEDAFLEELGNIYDERLIVD